MIINIQGCRSLNFFLSFSISNLLTKPTLTILVNNKRKKKLEYHCELHEMAGENKTLHQKRDEIQGQVV